MKQYLMICDDRGIQQLRAMFNPECVQFLEVNGMPLGNNNAYNLLVTPILPPVNPARPCAEPEQPPVEAPTEPTEPVAE